MLNDQLIQRPVDILRSTLDRHDDPDNGTVLMGARLRRDGLHLFDETWIADIGWRAGDIVINVNDPDPLADWYRELKALDLMQLDRIDIVLADPMRAAPGSIPLAVDKRANPIPTLTAFTLATLIKEDRRPRAGECVEIAVNPRNATMEVVHYRPGHSTLSFKGTLAETGMAWLFGLARFTVFGTLTQDGLRLISQSLLSNDA